MRNGAAAPQVVQIKTFLSKAHQTGDKSESLRPSFSSNVFLNSINKVIIGSVKPGYGFCGCWGRAEIWGPVDQLAEPSLPYQKVGSLTPDPPRWGCYLQLGQLPLLPAVFERCGGQSPPLFLSDVKSVSMRPVDLDHSDVDRTGDLQVV